MTRARMITRAREVRRRAWAPYSHFKVGVCLRDDRGRLFVGCNVENAAYPQGVCAEASAISALVAAGGRRILECVVVGGGKGPCAPCGGCRQKLAEFMAPEARVVMTDPRGRVTAEAAIADLLPLTFGPANLRR